MINHARSVATCNNSRNAFRSIRRFSSLYLTRSSIINESTQLTTKYGANKRFALPRRFFSSDSNDANNFSPSGSSNNKNSDDNNNDNGQNNDDDGKPSLVILSDGNGDSPANGSGIFGNGFKALTLPILPKREGTLETPKPPDFFPVLPIIIGSKKPHFAPYTFIYNVTDPDLAEVLQYRFKTKQPYVSIFLKRFDLDADVKNIQDLMPCGTMGEILEIKASKGGISVLIKGHYRIKLKSFINKTIVEQINEEEKLDKSKIKQVDKAESKNELNSQKLRVSARQISKMRRHIRARHERNAAKESIVDGEPIVQKAVPLFVDTSKMEDEIGNKDPRTKALASELVKALSEIYFVNPLILEYIHLLYPQHQEMFDSPAAICNFVASQFQSVTPEESYKVFAAEHIDDKIELSLNLARKELEMRKIGQQISKEVDDKIKSHHRKFLLNEQLKEIKKQLGVSKDDKDAIEEKIRAKVAEVGEKFPADVKKVVDEELNKLSFLDSHSSEFSVTRNYLDWLTSIPWGNFDNEVFDLNHTGTVLDNDHYGMQDVKKRIKEFVAIAKLKKKSQGKILCFHGPPGVGKTSIGKSIAASLNRKYFRFSVGGMFDVAEIKGHRRTYVGAMPGKAVQCLKKVKTMNPLILIDEIDKIGRASQEGDCSSALLEMLDPEQNSSFLDHYLDVPVDLSNVLFICTANVLHTIPEPLKDRMEIIEVSGYTPDEKIKIAEKHLIPKVLEESGIGPDQVSVTESGLKKIVDEYSRESGVRGLRQSIEKIFRRSAVKLVDQHFDLNKDEEVIITEENPIPSEHLEITDKNLVEFADRPKYQPDLFYGCKSALPVGIVTGLAWTGNGGSTLYIESVFKSNAISHPTPKADEEENSKSAPGNIQMTGNLGKVMQESMSIASTYAQKFIAQIDPSNDKLQRLNVHLHVPEGAVPKDGPSAGITITSALVSLALDKPIASTFAMSGEISLNGRVLPVGGIREKIIAAKREGVKNIILPQGVKNNFDDMPKSVHEGLDVHFVENYEEVYRILFK